MGDRVADTGPTIMEPHTPPPREVTTNESVLPEGFEHPRGTLAVVGVFGLLFALAWLATYLFVFLERGAPHLHP